MANKAKSKTLNQIATPMYGGSGFNGPGYVVKSEAGINILPGYAPLVGSGSFEGRQPYANTLYGSGQAGTAFTGLGVLPGYGTPLPGLFHVYRWMLAHPTIALARMTVVAPIIAGKRIYCKTDDAPSEAMEVIEEHLERNWLYILIDLLRAIDFGFAAQELVWGTDRNGYRLPRLYKSLLPDLTTMRVDEHGELVGIKNSVDLDDPYYLLFTYDREGSNFYGRSRLENCRRTWMNWLADEDQLYRLEQKAAGILPEVGFPPDNETPATPSDSNYQRALNLANSLSQGRGVVHENFTGASVDDLIRAPDLAGRSWYTIKLHDMGNTGPSQMALIESLRYKDALLVRGYLRPERMVIEASRSGSRADSETHANAADADIDMIHTMICDAVNRGVINPILEQNFGAKARDSVYVKPREMVDEAKLLDQKMLEAVMMNGEALYEVLKSIDTEEWAQRVGIPLKEDGALDFSKLQSLGYNVPGMVDKPRPAGEDDPVPSQERPSLATKPQQSAKPQKNAKTKKAE